MTTVEFNLPAAQDALARSDEGHDPQPGDANLIAAYDDACQQAWLRADDERREAELADWLTGQCGECEMGGTGEPCDEHYIDADDQHKRAQDL